MKGDVCVLLPEDSGFEPGDDVKLIKIGEVIPVLHAWDTKVIEELPAEQAAFEAIRPAQ